MPDPLDRATFLLRVADAVDLQPAEVGEVLEELTSHLSDAAAGWRAAGLDVDDAEQRAIRSLGDPATLGHELGRARHRRRHLLAAVGGAAFSALGFGAASLAMVWLLAAAVVLCALSALIAITQVTGMSGSGWLTGPSASVGTVVLAVLWFAWMGWALPARVARRVGRSVRGVRLAVGIGGLVAWSVVLWTLYSTDMDWILAIGLPLGPVAFLLAALRPATSVTTFPRTTARGRLALLLAVVAATTGAGFATVQANDSSSWWSGDVSSIGVASDTEPLLAGSGSPVNWGDVQGGPGLFASYVVGDPSRVAAFEQRFSTFRLEVWPVTVVDHQVNLGPAPLAVAATPVASEMVVGLDVPSPRSPVQVEAVVVLVARDGTRVVLDPGGLDRTPPWKGTLLDWWCTSR